MTVSPSGACLTPRLREPAAPAFMSWTSIDEAGLSARVHLALTVTAAPVELRLAAL
jgi:hypothetical protein